MSTVDEALQTQIRNIEEKYGKSLAEWIALIRESGITKHTEIIAMLKSQYGVTHGSANRLALIAREADAASISRAAKAAGSDPIDDMYSGKKAGLKPLYDALISTITSFGNDIEVWICEFRSNSPRQQIREKQAFLSANRYPTFQLRILN